MYEELDTQQTVTIHDCAKMLKSLLLKGPLWRIELPKEQQIKLQGLQSNETFGGLNLLNSILDWYWQPSFVNLGTQDAGQPGNVYGQIVELFNPNDFDLIIESYGIEVLDGVGSFFSMQFLGPTIVNANSYLEVEFQYNLETQAILEQYHEVRFWVYNSNPALPSNTLSININIVGVFPV